jgi:NAD(P)-dependent dehydrogenase (short-subunit alcohol dehydrogenase family)
MARTVVITGANRGIGLAVVQALAAHADAEALRVVMVCRDPAAGDRARAALGPTRAELVVLPGALDSVRKIAETADSVNRECPRIDVLIHNAGIWPGRLVRTEGLEQAFVVNHLAPFLLNHRLEAALQAGAARVVQVSAGLYIKGKVDLARTPSGEDFSALTTYATTKLCNLLLLQRWSEHFAPLGVTINALHPGVIRTGLGDRSDLLGVVIKLVKRLWKAPEQAAPPILRLALDPTLAGVTGRYYDNVTEQALAPLARDPQLAAALWEQAEQLTAVATHSGSPRAHTTDDKSAAR